VFPDQLPNDRFYMQYPAPSDLSASGFAPRRARTWTSDNLESLKRGLLSIASDPHYSRLRDKYYWIAQYIMDGEFSKDDVRRQINKMARNPERFA
jgi:hypothetical protein